VTGSTTLLPIAEEAAQGFQEQNEGTSVLVSGLGSSAGIEAVSAGTSDIGTSSRDLKEEEEGLRNWKDVGGEDRRIDLVNRDEASGTREAFKKIVMGEDAKFDRSAVVLPGTGQVREVVSQSAGAIGYISVGFVEPRFTESRVKSVLVDGVVASEETVTTKQYPIARTLHFFTKGEPTGLAKEYIDFVLSDAVQEDVVIDAGFVPVTAGGD